MTAHPELIAQNAQFPKEVVEIAPGAFTAVGYAASTVHMLVGADGLVIVDTTESTGAAENIFAEFRRITDLPVKTIIYTHSHRDHISGATVFAEGGAPEVIASARFESDLVGTEGKPGPHAALGARTKRQFGIGLQFPDERVNLGCGPGDRPMKGLGAGHMAPTNLIAEDCARIERCGWSIDLIAAPGEAFDNIMVWLPQHRALIPGDNYYHSFPNLAPIRGSAYRDFDAWVASLETMLALEAEVMAPGHTRPVFGADQVRERLTDYRDAVAHVIRATADMMNASLGHDEIATRIALPPRLAEKPWLKEFYGRLDWSARSYAVGTLGWFDGNPTNLSRLAPADEARRMIALAGGAEAVLAAAARADDPQWAMELADRLIAADEMAAEARAVKIAAMRKAADAQINATARNYYLLSANELEAS